MPNFKDSVDDVAALVSDGDSVALGGFILYRKPMALVRALVRSGCADLDLIVPIGSTDVDLLAGTGQVRRLTFAFCNLDIVGAAPNFRASVESGRLVADEQGTLTLMRGLEAGERDIPALPARALLGSDLQRDLDVQSVDGRRLVAAPAVTPDVALIHVAWADTEGNVRIPNEGFDFALAKAATRVGVTVERVVSEREFEQLGGVVLEAADIDALAVSRFGAHPTSCWPMYVHDVEHLLDYVEAYDGDTASYVDAYRIHDGEQGYVSAVGVDRLTRLLNTMDVGRSYVP